MIVVISRTLPISLLRENSMPVFRSLAIRTPTLAGFHHAAALGPVVLVLSVLFSPWGPARWASAETARRPNIIWFIADDLGYGELGCQGNPEIPTPRIDALAASGIRMTQGYVAASYCSQSRAGLMTARYPNRFGYEYNPIGHENEDPRLGLPASERTVAELLFDHGYATALIGKWHLGGTAAYHPNRRGFEYFFGFLHEGHFFVPPPYQDVYTLLRRKQLPSGGQGRTRHGNLVLSTHMKQNEPAYDANNPILRNGQPVQESTYLTDALTREAVSFIQRNQDRPFFLTLSYNAVHSPLQATIHDVEQVSAIDDIHRRIFAGMLVSLDRSVGQVLQTLTDLQLEDDTFVCFLSDNGGPTRELTSSNLPLRAGKGSVYEGGIRVPFLIRWPRQLEGGQLYQQPVSALDLLPTAAALAGIKDVSERKLDGVNLIPYLSGAAAGSAHPELYWRMGDRRALRMGDWKIVHAGRNQSWELYNLANDIGEADDLAREHPKQLARLRQRFDELNQEMEPAAWSRNRSPQP